MKNLVLIQGNLTRDPEMRYGSKGDAVAKIGLAVNETWERKDGTKGESSVFLDLTAFGPMAEKAARDFKKGSAMVVIGKLKTESWDDRQTGQKRTKLVVVANIITSPFAGGPKLPESRPARPAPAQAPKPAQPELPPIADDTDDSTPF